MEKKGNVKVGVYVDVANIAQNGGYGMQYDILREFACRNDGTAMRLNAYVAFDEQRAKEDAQYRQKAHSYYSLLRDFGYKVIVKKVKWHIDEKGMKFGKSNADLEMAVDALLQSERLDYVLMVTGDGDFLQVIKALQNKGCRVDVLAFKNVSRRLREEADMFISGYLVPDLLPIEKEKDEERHRGICYSFLFDKGYGFMRYQKRLTGGLWITDTRKEESPYETAFVHSSKFPLDLDVYRLPNREMIFDFRVIHDEEGRPQAEDLKLVYDYGDISQHY
jgi:uncharacterized LabA/DUF88 family protein